MVLALAILVQFLLAGIGVFAIPDAFFLHGTVNAAVIFFGGLVVLFFGWRAGAPRGDLQMTGAIPALVVLQSVLLIPYHLAAPAPVRALAGLHVVNALVIFFVATRLVERARGIEVRRV